VTRRVLHPKLPISPTLERISVSQRTDLGRVIYANSITLTPGTISIELDEDTVLVHAISAAGMADLKGAEMSRRVCALEGES